MLGISLNLSLDSSHESGGFYKILLEKSLEFAPNRRDNTIAFHLGFQLLPEEVESIVEEQSRTKYVLETRGTGHVKIVLTLLIDIVALHVEATIV